MADNFASHAPSLESPADYLFDVTPSDVGELERVTKAIHLNEPGDVRVTTSGMPDGTSVTLRNIPVGVPYPVRARRIWQTGTTSTDIVGCA